MSALTERSRALLVAAQLLGYPDEELMQRLPMLGTAGRDCGAATPFLGAFLDELGSQQLAVAQARYVETFDLRRRCCLYLTYYTYGDTRKRGMALLRFSHAYRAAGYQLEAAELPDHLAVVCEFAAHAPDDGVRLLREHRAGVELLRMALADGGSPYLDVVDAVRAVLPEPAPRDLDRAIALAQAGPPAEEVGLEPFGPPEYTGARP